jgi:hypothetical protein
MLKTYGDIGFEAAAAIERNLLPLDIKSALSVATFKTHLKTILFRQHFEIPIDHDNLIRLH